MVDPYTEILQSITLHASRAIKVSGICTSSGSSRHGASAQYSGPILPAARVVFLTIRLSRIDLIYLAISSPFLTLFFFLIIALQIRFPKIIYVNIGRAKNFHQQVVGGNWAVVIGCNTTLDVNAMEMTTGLI